MPCCITPVLEIRLSRLCSGRVCVSMQVKYLHTRSLPEHRDERRIGGAALVQPGCWARWGRRLPCGTWGGDCRLEGRQPGEEGDVRNVFAQKGVGFHSSGAVNTPAISSFWPVYPEISAGYVGVSYPSLEFVHKSRLTPPPPPHPLATETKTRTWMQKTQPSVCCLQGLLISLFLGSDNALSPFSTVSYSNYP